MRSQVSPFQVGIEQEEVDKVKRAVLLCSKHQLSRKRCFVVLSEERKQAVHNPHVFRMPFKDPLQPNIELGTIYALIITVHEYRDWGILWANAWLPVRNGWDGDWS
jgi:hypothetical protein